MSTIPATPSKFDINAFVNANSNQGTKSLPYLPGDKLSSEDTFTPKAKINSSESLPIKPDANPAPTTTAPAAKPLPTDTPVNVDTPAPTTTAPSADALPANTPVNADTPAPITTTPATKPLTTDTPVNVDTPAPTTTTPAAKPLPTDTPVNVDTPTPKIDAPSLDAHPTSAIKNVGEQLTTPTVKSLPPDHFLDSNGVESTFSVKEKVLKFCQFGPAPENIVVTNGGGTAQAMHCLDAGNGLGAYKAGENMTELRKFLTNTLEKNPGIHFKNVTDDNIAAIVKGKAFVGEVINNHHGFMDDVVKTGTHVFPHDPAGWALGLGTMGLAALGGWFGKDWLAKNPQAAAQLETSALKTTRQLSKAV